MLQASRLKCEYQNNPIGIGDLNPRLSWIVESNRENVMQTGYHLQVARDKAFESLVWDTGEVVSDQSNQVTYEGQQLEEATRYYYRVKISDNYGEQSEWSEVALFEIALLNSKNWEAQFISIDLPEDGGNLSGKLLRHTFELKGEVESARIYATALGMYELYMNGQRIGESLLTPGWTNYKERLQYQTYDVTNLLEEGANGIGAIVGAGWYCGNLPGGEERRNIYGSKTAVLVQMIIKYKDGTQEHVVSDENWKGNSGPIRYSELYHGEIYDAREEQKDWSKGSFDDSKWDKVCIIPMNKEIMTPQDGLYVSRHEVLSPQAYFVTPTGERVIDFGQNIAGWVRFKVKGNSGERVVLKHAEVLDANGNFYTENLRSAKACIEYTLKGGEEEIYEPHFTFQGFRYVKLEEYPGEIDLESIRAIVIHSDMERIGAFKCSNSLVNQLSQNILWGLKGNFVDIPTDCPQRDERLGWTGDAQVFIRTACFLMQTAPLFKKWLRDLKSEQLSNGGVPHVIPDILSDMNSPDKSDQVKNEHSGHSATGWADAAVICPWTIYQSYGDVKILEEQYESMKNWIGYIKNHTEGGLLWKEGDHFGDWVALDAHEGSYHGATPNDFIATAFYAYSTELLSKIAQVLGENDDYQLFAGLHDEIVEAFQKEYYTTTGDLVAQTQTAHVLVLKFNLVEEEYREKIVNNLVKLINDNTGHLTTGFLGTPYICHVLSENGRLEEAYGLLLKDDYPSWLYQVKQGATTIWEHWDGIKPDGTMWSADMNSFNHYAYGAVGEWLYRVVAGLNIEEQAPGYKKVIIKPQPGGGITSASLSYASMYGDIKIEWEIKEGVFDLEVVIPHNTTAQIELSNIAEKSLSIDHEYREVVDGKCVITIGSGKHHYQYKYNKQQ